MATIISCPYCGKRTDPRLDTCVHCGGDLSKQRQSVGKSSPPKESAARAQGSPTCPNCGALVKKGDIICVACGTNLLTGRALREAPPSETTTAPAAPSDSQAGRWVAIGAAAAALILIAFAVWALTRDPVRTAERLYAQGRMMEALESLDSYREEHPQDSQAHFAVGRIHLLEGEPGKAAPAFEQAYANQTHWDEAARLAALAYMRAGNAAALANAEAVAEDYAQREPDNPEAWELLARIRGAQEDYPAQADALAEKVRLTPEDAEAQRRLAAALALAGQGNEAAERAQMAIRFGQETLPLSHAIEALAAMSMKNPAIAEPALNQAIELNAPMQAHMLVARGLLRLENGRMADAEADFKAALEADTRNAAARFFRAVCQLALGFPSLVLDDLDTLQQGDGPFAGQAAALAARIHLERGELAAAQEAIDSALSKGAASPVVYTIQGRIAVAQGDAAAAGEAFRKAAAAGPAYAPAHLEAGLLLVRRGLVDEGLTELRNYLNAIDPNLPDANVDAVRALMTRIEANTSAAQSGAPEGS